MSVSSDYAKRSARVYFRILPEENVNWDCVNFAEDGYKIRVRNLQDFNIKKNEKEKNVENYRVYTTDGVFVGATQQDVFNKVTHGVLQSVFDGSNAVIMAYGQTGTGKSTTIHGLQNSYEDRGIAPRLVPDLFKYKGMQERYMKTIIHMSYIEINKTGVTDLLAPLPNHYDTNSLKHISKIKVTSEDDVFQLLFKAEGRKNFLYDRTYPSNTASSILTFLVTKKNVSVINALQKTARLHIVDLAGVDTVGNWSSAHREPLDIGTANTIKSQMDQFIMVLNTALPDHIRVKQRINCFIQYLGKSLTSKSTLRIIGHITSRVQDLMITHSMLRFGQSLLGIKAPTKETDYSEYAATEKSLRELQELKQEKIYQAIFMNDGLATNITQDRLGHMKNVVEEYVEDKTNEITVLNVTDANLILQIFKEYCQDIKNQQGKLAKEEYNRGFTDGVASVNRPSKTSLLKTHHSKMSRESAKSKETGSLQHVNRHSSSISTTSLRKKERSLSKNETISNDVDTNSRKRSYGSGTNSVRKISSKRQTSTNSLLIMSGHGKSHTNDVPDLLPQVLPEFEEAWTAYKSDESTDYNKLVELFLINDKSAREAYRLYLCEVEKLQFLLDLATVRQNELMQATMIRKYSEKYRFDSDGSELMNDAEIACLKNKKIADKNVHEQQEVVLRYQAELRIYLRRKQDLKKQIQDGFDEYCCSKYSAPIISQSVQDSKHLLDDLLYKVEEESEAKMEEKCTTLESSSLTPFDEGAYKFEQFKRFMFKEMKNKQQQEKQKDWVTNLK